MGSVGVPTRGPESQQVNAACFLVPDDDARDNTVTHDLSWFRPRGRTSSKRVWESTVLSCTGDACSRGYKQCERGREVPMPLLEEELIEVSANIGAQKSICAL